jgi:hypothetical protein
MIAFFMAVVVSPYLSIARPLIVFAETSAVARFGDLRQIFGVDVTLATSGSS